MGLPYPGMDAVPFTPLTAEFLDDIISNIESISGGTGFATSAITTASLADSNVTTGKLAAAAVTPDKRSGGFAIGTVSTGVLGSTGNSAITGLGFQPKLVRFTSLMPAGTVSGQLSVGAMTASAQFLAAVGDSSATSSRNSRTDACIGYLGAGLSTWNLVASYVSMDSDGFTINVSTASSSLPFAFEAYA